MTLAYRVELTPDDNGTLLVTAPALPELTTFGEAREQALDWAMDAAETLIWSYMREGRAIPPGDAGAADENIVQLSWLVTLKVELHNLCLALGVSRVELARRLGWHREQVDRLFRLNHASRLDQLEAAFKALGREVDLQVRVAA